jgi:hypothetical protein
LSLKKLIISRKSGISKEDITSKGREIKNVNSMSTRRENAEREVNKHRYS